MKYLTVGQVAKRSGVSVKTLHHYDELGLLTAQNRSDAGYRLYTLDDLKTLKNILVLKNLGFQLQEIKEVIHRGCDLEPFISARISETEKVLQQRQQELAKLQQLSELHNRTSNDINTLLTQMERIVMFEKHFTQEQLAELKKERDVMGPEALTKAEQDWTQLIADVQTAMNNQLSPSSDQAQALAKRWHDLVLLFTQGKPEREQALANMYQQEADAHEQAGLSPDMMNFIHQAMENAGITMSH